MPRSPLIPRKAFPSRTKTGSDTTGETRAIAGAETWTAPATLSGVAVTSDTVTTLGAYYAALVVLASDLGTVDFNVTQRNTNGARAVAFDHPYQDLVYFSPNEEMTAQTFREASVWHLCTRGNAYGRIRRVKGKVASVELLDPDKTRPARIADGSLYYVIEGEESALAADIIHVKAPGYNGIEGRSPVQQSRETLGVAMAVERFGASFFGRGLNHGGVLTTPESLDEVETEALRQQIEFKHAGPQNAHRFMLLQGGMSFTPNSISLADAEYLLARRFTVEEMARLFRLPLSKLQSLDKASYGMLEESNLDYYISSLLPWIRRFEFEWTRKLFSRDERRVYSVLHDQAHTLKGRMIDQANVFKILRELGVLSADEIREFYGRAPIEGGQTYLVPLNQAPLDKVAAATLETLKGVKATPKAEDQKANTRSIIKIPVPAATHVALEVVDQLAADLVADLAA